jgi:hypothetical protein
MGGVGRRGFLPIAWGLGALAVPAAALGHAERPTTFPDPAKGSVPEYRTDGPARVVCKPGSAQRIRATVRDRGRRARAARLLAGCDHEHIQQAVDAAQSGDRILVLPGVYREEPSRAVPLTPEECKDMRLPDAGGAGSYDFHWNCPNAENLIAVMGDDPGDADKECDLRCHLQIEGMGDSRDDVLIVGDRHKLNVIRADRADGIHLRNFTVQFSDFNNIYALETNGFRFDNIESRYSREYGFLSFSSDHGLYQDLDAHHAGDSGVYPGSGPERPGEPCDPDDPGTYGIEIRRVDSHDNTIGYSGTAGNRVWAHGNRFHDNATGMTTDSFASGHPGMPQDCVKWEDNLVHSNNADLFNAERDAYCRETPSAERDPEKVCPTFQVPVGTGLMIAGGNDDLVRGNRIWDNWRDGAKLLYVPAAFRGEPDKGVDTSFGNRFEGNLLGMAPGGAADPNGNDFWWDEQGRGNCWVGNAGPGGQPATHNVPTGLPECGSNHPELVIPAPLFMPGDPVKSASQASCATWHPEDNPDPPGCDWFERPPEPQP